MSEILCDINQYMNGQENVAYSLGKRQPIYINLEMIQMFEISDKNFKATI